MQVSRSTFVRRRLGLAVCLVLGALVWAQAQAMTLRELRALELSDKKQGANYVRYYLVGVMEGVLEAHAQSVRAGAKPSICVDKRRLEPRMAQDIFDAEMRRGQDMYEADMNVQLVVTQALATVYPC